MRLPATGDSIWTAGYSKICARHWRRQAIAHQIDLDSCDVDDLENVMGPAGAALDADLPNIDTLTTYLNSLARSLRAAPRARTALLQLDAAMRNAAVPTQWEH